VIGWRRLDKQFCKFARIPFSGFARSPAFRRARNSPYQHRVCPRAVFICAMKETLQGGRSWHAIGEENIMARAQAGDRPPALVTSNTAETNGHGVAAIPSRMAERVNPTGAIHGAMKRMMRRIAASVQTAAMSAANRTRVMSGLVPTRASGAAQTNATGIATRTGVTAADMGGLRGPARRAELVGSHARRGRLLGGR
jgi:hypothetical protein